MINLGLKVYACLFLLCSSIISFLLVGPKFLVPDIMDTWDLPPFSSLSPSPLSHFLWDMITNDEGISSEIWDQFIGSNVPSIAF